MSFPSPVLQMVNQGSEMLSNVSAFIVPLVGGRPAQNNEMMTCGLCIIACSLGYK